MCKCANCEFLKLHWRKNLNISISSSSEETLKIKNLIQFNGLYYTCNEGDIPTCNELIMSSVLD